MFLWHDQFVSSKMIPIIYFYDRDSMQKRCSSCSSFITENNCVKREGKGIRGQCRPCINNRNKKYLQDKGIVQWYECENCGKQCLRSQVRALCSLKCRLLGNIEKVECVGMDSECWKWKGKKTSDGYGEIMISRIRYRTHRVSYEVFKGSLSPDNNIILRHRCDNPSCINPTHLEQGTNGDNMRDMKERGRSLKGNKNPMNQDLSQKRIILSNLIKKHTE